MTSPTLTGFSPTITFGETLVNGAPQLLDTAVVFNDAEGTFNGGTLTVSGLLAEDRVSVNSEGMDAGQIQLSGSDVLYGGVTIGTLSGGVGNTLTITFNASASTAGIDALIQNLTYANVSDSPTLSRSLTLNIIDADGDGLNAQMATFSQLTGASNPFSSYGSGTAPAPTFADIDGDGDVDLVVGTGTPWSSSGNAVRTFTNNGSGVFSELTGTSNPFNGLISFQAPTPSLVDLDSDGDMDVVMGTRDGLLKSFANNGSGVFTELTGASNPFNGVDVGSYCRPSFGDIDGDGDIDAVVGTQSGTLRTFANNGVGVFTELTGGSNPLSSVSASWYSAPSIVDLDGDGDMDVVMGQYWGNLRAFVNNGAGGFTELTGSANPLNSVNGTYNMPTFVDIDSDGDMDAVVGDYFNGLRLYQNTTPRGSIIAVTVTAEADPISGSGIDDDLVGTGAADTLLGFAGFDTLDGGAGADTMEGGADNDRYIVDNALDIIVEGMGQGTADTVAASVSFTLAADDYIEVMTTTDAAGTGAINLTGNRFSQAITGNAGANVLSDGGGGADTLTGLEGNDTYIVRHAATQIVEDVGGGTADRVAAGASFVLAADDHIEVMTTTSSVGTDAINLTGNGFAQTITGNAGANTLSDGGGAGVDTMSGGLGNDTYIVSTGTTQVVEGAGQGSADVIMASVSFVLEVTDHIELLTTTDAAGTDAINLTGNRLAQSITGNAGANVLSDGGGTGADTLTGGAGSDSYIVRNSGSQIVEGVGEGTADRVSASVSFVLASDDHIESLTTTSFGATTAINLTGNAVSQSVIGNAGANTLSGLDGNDTLTGGGGADSFVFNTALGAGNVDTIMDFDVAADTIVLDHAVFADFSVGLLSGAAFASNTSGLAIDADDRVIYESDTGRLLYDVDGTGSEAAVQFAQVRTSPTLTADDFLVI